MGDDDRIAAIITALELMVDLMGSSANELINSRMNSLEDQAKRVAAEKNVDDAAMNAGRRAVNTEVSDRFKMAGQKFKGHEARIQTLEAERKDSNLREQNQKGKDDNGHQNAGNGSNDESYQAGTESAG